jgi:ribosomal protein L18E
LSLLWRRDPQAVREALSRVVKRISIKRRLNIIRSVNEAIDKVNEDENSVSFSKIAKILNLCHIFVPIVSVNSNNSTDLSLDINDLIEMTKSKEKYKRYV